MGTYFYPRGGSAHVARALARELETHGIEVTLVSGSRTDLGPAADADDFYAGLDVRAVDFTPALRIGAAARLRRPARHGADARLLRGPRGRRRPGADLARRPPARAAGGRLGAGARARRGGRRRPALPPPPDPARRGGGPRPSRRADHRPHPRHRAADARGDRGGGGRRPGPRRGVDGAPRPLGGGLRAAGGRRREGGRPGGGAARPPDRAVLGPAERLRPDLRPAPGRPRRGLAGGHRPARRAAPSSSTSAASPR